MDPSLSIVLITATPPVPKPVRKVAAGTLMGTLLALSVLVAVLVLVAMRRTQRRRQAARRARETEHRNAWAEAGRRLPVPDAPGAEERAAGEAP